MVELWFQYKDWEGEDSDEVDDSDEDIDVSDNDDLYFDKKAKGRQRGKFGPSVRSTRDCKAFTASSRQRRVKSSFEDEDENSTAEDSDSESDEDFKSLKKRGVRVRKNNGRSSAATSFSRPSNEVRSSSRTIRKVSYVESDESEGADEGTKKSQKVLQLSMVSFSSTVGIWCKCFGLHISTNIP